MASRVHCSELGIIRGLQGDGAALMAWAAVDWMKVTHGRAGYVLGTWLLTWPAGGCCSGCSDPAMLRVQDVLPHQPCGAGDHFQ